MSFIASPRFDLSHRSGKTVAGMVALCHWGELFWRGTRPAECGDRGMSSWNSYLCEELNFGGLCGKYSKRGASSSLSSLMVAQFWNWAW